MNLKFTAIKVAEIEDEKNASLLDVLQDSRLSNLAFIISKGCNSSVEEAFKKIDEYVASGKSTEELYLHLGEALQKDGFLSKAMDFNAMRLSLEDAVKEASKKTVK